MFRRASTNTILRRLVAGYSARGLTTATRKIPRIHPSLVAFYSASLFGTLTFAYMMKDYAGPRERVVYQQAVDLKKDQHHGYIVDYADFEYVGPKPDGELSGAIIRHKVTGKMYVMKGAREKDALIDEFLIATFLSKLRPDVQPKSLILEKKLDNGQARFYTLSEILPNSMDLAEFASQEDYKEKLAKKPLVGFEEAIAIDLMLAKQADMKLSNYIVRETDDAYVVSSIDHEMSGRGYQAKRVFTNDMDVLAYSLREMNQLSSASDNDAMEYATIQKAREFMEFSKPFLNPEKVAALYGDVIKFDMNKMLHVIEDIDGTSGVITRLDGHRFAEKMLDIAKDAKLYCFDHHFYASDEFEEMISVLRRARL